MLKYFISLFSSFFFAIAPFSAIQADPGDQDPPLSPISPNAFLPSHPCPHNDAACEAFVSGRLYPISGIPSSVWRDARCLSVVAFHEARGEGPLGMKAVIWVALNRAVEQEQSPCRIVTAPGQFSPRSRQHLQKSIRSGSMPPPIRLSSRTGADAEALAWARGLAWRILQGELTYDPTYGATYFHADYIRPYWARQFLLTTQIGSHLFYQPL